MSICQVSRISIIHQKNSSILTARSFFGSDVKENFTFYSVMEEIEALEAILMDDVSVKRSAE